MEGGGNDQRRGASKIEMSAMDGTGRTAIITQGLGVPRAVTVDHPVGAGDGGRIYWTDEFHGRIESANLDGSDRTVVVGKFFLSAFKVTSSEHRPSIACSYSQKFFWQLFQKF